MRTAQLEHHSGLSELWWCGLYRKPCLQAPAAKAYVRRAQPTNASRDNWSGRFTSVVTSLFAPAQLQPLSYRCRSHRSTRPLNPFAGSGAIALQVDRHS
jgi:hypothetical protein